MSSYQRSPHAIERYINKAATDFTKADIVKYIIDNDIEMLNFRYPAGDGRLKTLNFVVYNEEQLEELLSSGERVDGSSLFSYIEAGNSDLYVVPRFKTAFLNPFEDVPTVDILCSFFDKDYKPFQSAPDYTLRKAHDVLKTETGYDFQVMGELEYYVIAEREDLFMADDQRGYHEANPFAKWEDLRKQAMYVMAAAGCKIKYSHSEVGNFTQGDYEYEQNEIEFQPCPIDEAADQLVIAKWLLRTLAYQHGVTVTFAPKITVGKAGSGLHIHTRLMKNGKNVMLQDGKISDVARQAIAGYLKLAPSLTAFGNTNPTSYFRLVPHQEAPTNICWGDRNRSVLVRVPLGWTVPTHMLQEANPLEDKKDQDFSHKQTVEMRCPDGSADVYLLLAGLTVAARVGLQAEDSLAFADKTYVDVNIFDEAHKERLAQLEQLPVNCSQSADCLLAQKESYLQYGVFNEATIQGVAARLKSFNDDNLRADIATHPDKIMDLVRQYFHCG